MTTNYNKQKVEASIDILLEYKKGLVNLCEAADRFQYLTGLDRSVCEEFITSMSRENVIKPNLKQ